MSIHTFIFIQYRQQAAILLVEFYHHNRHLLLPEKNRVLHLWQQIKKSWQHLSPVYGICCPFLSLTLPLMIQSKQVFLYVGFSMHLTILF